MTYLFGIIPVPPPMQAQSRVHDLQIRLDWGEPGLTIIDTRDRTSFRTSHIRGAVSMPLDELVERALLTLEVARDIYVYGETDDETAIAATYLREAGYVNVSELRGGLAAWKAVSYPIEGGTAAA
jgi:rhodanese-related sulfurtransferase